MSSGPQDPAHRPSPTCSVYTYRENPSFESPPELLHLAAAVLGPAQPKLSSPPADAPMRLFALYPRSPWAQQPQAPSPQGDPAPPAGQSGIAAQCHHPHLDQRPLSAIECGPGSLAKHGPRADCQEPSSLGGKREAAERTQRVP